jgi:hypothetical protein
MISLIMFVCSTELQEEVAAPYVRLMALLVRRNQATIGGEGWLGLVDGR